MAGTETMRAAEAEAVVAREEAAERSGLREGEDVERKPRDAAGAMVGGLRAAVEVGEVEREEGAAAAMECVAFRVREGSEREICE